VDSENIRKIAKQVISSFDFKNMNGGINNVDVFGSNENTAVDINVYTGGKRKRYNFIIDTNKENIIASEIFKDVSVILKEADDKIGEIINKVLRKHAK